jgi:hypothetical protein
MTSSQAPAATFHRWVLVAEPPASILKTRVALGVDTKTAAPVLTEISERKASPAKIPAVGFTT